MADNFLVYVFGDQTYDIGVLLSKLLHTHGDPILSAFLERSCQALKNEVAELRPSQRVLCPRFSKLRHLLALWRANTLNPALSQALFCICQIGTFINELSETQRPFPTRENACLTGRCTGLLSATAVSSSSNLSSLLFLGVRTVAVAFRVGACAWDIGSRFCLGQGEADPYQSWTVALAGIDQETLAQAIERFGTENVLPKSSTPYISARVTPTQYSISGPPEVLNSFLSATNLGRASNRLPITAPYHAGHLYCDEDIDYVFSGLLNTAAEADFPTSQIPIISSTTGEVLPPAPFPEALRKAVKESLQTPIHWDLVARGVASHVQSSLRDGDFAVHHVAMTPDTLESSTRELLGQAGLKIRHHSVETPRSYVPMNPHTAPVTRTKIAITGMSGRFPQAQSMEALWQVLVQGVDTHELVPSTRWEARTHVSNMIGSPPKNVSGTGFGCWLHGAAQFDTRFFNMSPREAPQVDPAQRIALMVATEALEQAGIVPGRTPSTEKDRIGVYIGSTSNDWMETNSAQNIDTYFIPGGNRAFIPGRINYHFKFSGPSYTIDTACSSSLAAIHLACNALWKGEVDTAIVGGTNILTNPDMTAGLDRGHFLSRTGNCKTFDDSADGYCRGEGVALAVLRRLDDALADNDPIQACILSIGTNHSAEAESITRPHVGAQHALFENVLADAGVDPTSITYCEMHGTGTQAGDAGETASVLDALAPKHPPAAMRKAQQPLYIGAAKSNIGHGEAAAGVTSLAKVLLMLKASTIPPHCGIKTKINHKLPDLQARHTFIARDPTHWPRPEHGARQVLLNNFSAAGGNTALVLEDGPEIALPSSPDARSHHVVAVSAKTPASLENNMNNLISWIDRRSDATNLTLSRLSYTTTARRMHHPHRVMVSGPDLRSISRSLGQCLEGNEGKTRAIGTPSFVFTFTGQGAQFDGMGVGFYSEFHYFKADIRRYDLICLQLGFPSIRGLFESQTPIQDSVNPTVLQLASVCFQMALSRMWISFGILPSVVVGHSLGEYAALHTAGVLSEVDVISLVGRRAQLFEQICERDSYGMLAIRSGAMGLKTLLGTPGKNYEISCLNTRDGTIIGGTKAQMSAVRPLLKRKGLSHTFLEVPYAYHTSQVDPILASLESIARSTTFRRPTMPVISPTLGKVVYEREDFGEDFVARHCRATVNMLDALTMAKSNRVLTEKMIGIEIGPAPVVVNMVKDSIGGSFRAFASCREGEDDWKLLTKVLSSAYTAGADINWMAYHKSFTSCQQCLSLPAYSWDLKEYWIQYEHGWSLRKGDPPARTNHQLVPTTTIHTIVKDTLSLSGGELVVEANLSREDLNPMVQGHKVYGVPLCTPSVYADIALTIGEYMMQILRLDTSLFAAEVADMTIQSALVANSSNNREQLLRTSARFDAVARSATCTFSSVDNTGKVTEQHSHCLVRIFEVAPTRDALDVAASSVRSRIASLESRVGRSGNTFRFSRAMIYKMIGQLADFDPKYRGLAEIILDNDLLEATGSVSFGKMPQVGTFHTNPAYIDALSQLGGFVMNGNENVDLNKELFVNHGWEALQLFESIDPARTYSTHVQMREGKDKLWWGDIVIFDAEKVVGTIRGVALQGVPKRLMQYIVKTANSRVSGPAPVGTAFRHPVQETIETSTLHTLTTTKAAESSTDLQPRPQTSMVESAMQILAQETGISANELTDRTLFADTGVDSLLSIVISSRIREELDIDLDLSIFLELDTISNFKHHLQEISGHIQEPIKTIQNPSCVVSELRTDLRIDTAHIAATWNSALSIIAEESGVSSKDLASDVSFADIGVDSLLSLVIGSRLRDELGIEISNMLFCLQFPTVGELESHITGRRHDGVGGNAGSDTSSDYSARVSLLSPIVDHASVCNSEASEISSSPSVASEPATLDRVKPAWSLSLQGTSSRAIKRLFLFPDGCGVATSYLSLPRISPSVAVIGFNSPFLRNSEGVSGRDLPEVLSSYCEALRKHQPHGPYHLGGWSAGGILAYAIAQELMGEGEEIASLTLIDSPAPTHGLDRLPRRFFDHCAEVGIFGTELGLINGGEGLTQKSVDLPEWLMSHFEATIELLHDYCAIPMPSTGNRPQKVRIIWAGTCAFDGDKYPSLQGPDAGDENTEGMRFLTKRRTDFGLGGWAQLFPGGDSKVDVLEGEHHFSMMRGRGAEMLVQLMREDMGVTKQQ